MNKKVLSAILFSALFAGTGTFTSCIDNDEPAGIEELRGAKAELLKAKVAVEQANAAYKLAEAEWMKAQAATEAANTRLQEALAEQQELANKLQEAKDKDEIAKLEAAEVAARQAAELAAIAHEGAMLVAKGALAEAQLTYENTLKQIEIAKAVMSEKSKLKLSELMTELNIEGLKGQIATQEGAVATAQHNLYAAMLYWNADSTYYIAKAEQGVTKAQAALDANAANIAKYEQYLAKDSTFEESAWREEIAKIEAELAEVNKQIAVFALDTAKALNGEERKAIDKAIADAKAAYDLESDSLNVKLAEDIKDTLLYYNGVENNKTAINIVADDSKTVAEAVIELAGADYAAAEDSLDYAGIIAGLRAEYNSYTTERIYWLDSIKNLDAAAVEAASKVVDAAVKAWEDSLAAYNAAKNFDFNTIYDASTRKGAVVDFIAADKSDATKEATALKALATSLVTAYNAVPAAQRTYNTIALPVPGKADGTCSTGDVVTFLSNADYKAEYMKAVLTYFGLYTNVAEEGEEEVLDYLSTATSYSPLWTTGAKATADTAGKPDKEAAEAVFGSMIQKEILGTDKKYTDANFDNTANKYGVTLLGKLINASETAFGSASLYVNDTEMTNNNLIQNGYLLHKPTLDDVRHAVKTYEVENTIEVPGEEEGDEPTITVPNGWKFVGIYGASLASSDAEVDFVANNYAAIKADLKAAIDKLTAFVDDYKEYWVKANADVEAANKVVIAAEKAYTDFYTAVIDKFTAATTELNATNLYLKRIYRELVFAVDFYLDVDYDYASNDKQQTIGEFTKFDAEKLFVQHLENQLKTYKSSVLDLEYAVACAKANLQYVMDGNFEKATLIEGYQKTLETEQAKLAELVKKLAEATEKLEAAEAIWYAAE